MTLDRFLSKNHIRLPAGVLELCRSGIRIMSDSEDPLHTVDHIYRMFDDLDLMMNTLHEINWKKINFQILILSIIWHDTYKSRHFAKSKRRMFFDHLLADGLGSMRLFTRYAKASDIDRSVINKVRYAIRKHSVIQFLPRNTQEARILKYLDELEDWSVKRLDHALQNIHTLYDVTPRIVPIFRFYFNHWMIRKKGSNHQPEWVKSEYRRRKSLYAREMGEKVRNFVLPSPPLHPSSTIERQTIDPENAE